MAGVTSDVGVPSTYLVFFCYRIKELLEDDQNKNDPIMTLIVTLTVTLQTIAQRRRRVRIRVRVCRWPRASSVIVWMDTRASAASWVRLSLQYMYFVWGRYENTSLCTDNRVYSLSGKNIPSNLESRVSKPRDWVLNWSHRSEFWQESRQRCCRTVSRFRDLAVRRPSA